MHDAIFRRRNTLSRIRAAPWTEYATSLSLRRADKSRGHARKESRRLADGHDYDLDRYFRMSAFATIQVDFPRLASITTLTLLHPPS